MGRKGSWICAVKKVISPPSIDKKQKKTRKSKRWFWRKNRKGLESRHEEIEAASPHSIVPEARWVEAEAEQTKYVDSVMEAGMNTEIVLENHANLAMDAETEQERLTAAARPPSKSKEEIASLKIQATFKGHMARRSVKSVKGLARLNKLVQGQSVKRQAITTLRYMQTMSRVQAEVRGRRMRMSEENCAFQRQLQLKHHKELEKSRAYIGEEWNSSSQSKEQFEAKQQRTIQAAIRRERALAYAYSHQSTWRNSSEPTHTFMEAENAQWGWNWLEKWMAVRPWENRAIEKEQISDTIHAKSATTLSQARRDLDLMKKTPSQIVSKRQSQVQGRPSLSSPQTKTHNVRAPTNRRSVSSADGDARSAQSVQSNRCRRHSVTQTSARDDESVASSSGLRSYMVPTESTKAKSRLSYDTAVLAAKRLSFSTSPSAPRRHSVMN